jgi:SAM-dependent methyltransferase
MAKITSMYNIQTFGQSSAQYAQHRPQYPPELFAYLSEWVAKHGAAWDCATGNGQAAVALARYFAHVEATDLSAEQIEHSLPHPNVRYSVSPAEHTPFAEGSFDLVTVAQAVHWFNLPEFYAEVTRVLKPNGVLAVWGYGFLHITPEIDAAIARALLKPIDRFWADGNRLVMAGYRDLVLPFTVIASVPALAMQVEWGLAQLLAYFRTWSAVKRYVTELGADPVAALEAELAPLWGEPEETKLVQMPVFLKASRKEI